MGNGLEGTDAADSRGSAPPGTSPLAGESTADRPPVDRFLGSAGFDRLAAVERFPGWSPLVWYAIAVVAVELVALQGYRLATGQVITFVENPLWLLRPLILLGAAVATESLHRRYDRALELSFLRKRGDDASQFETLVPNWLAAALVAVGVAFTLVNAVFVLTISQIYAAGGAARVVRFVVVTPFGYVPVLASFLATYLSVEVLLPRRLSRSDVGVDFLDPEKLGGMRPVGELVKFAYYYTMVGLVAYAVATYGPYALEGVLAYEGLEPPGLAVNVAFTAVWVAAVGTMVYGIFVLHRFMTREKREALHRLDRLAREAIDEPWDIERFEAANPPEAYERYRKQVEHVTATREYPATFTMWTQLLVGIVIPKALQMALAAI